MTILILGASSDIAVATARRFAQEKHDIILAGRDTSHLLPTVSDLQLRYNVAAHAVAFDATDYSSHATFYSSLVSKPDVVICFFGYLGDQETAQNNWTEAARIINTNYTGAVSILNIAANEMITDAKGCIIGVSSVAGDRGRMSNYIYGSAKAGFTAYLSGLRNRMTQHQLHAITIKPGFVATKMTADLPLPPMLTAKPEQVAQDIFKAYSRKKNVVYSLWFWRYIMLIIRFIPEFIFKKLKL